MRRLPIRARLTAAFALAMVLVLVVAGVFVYVRLRSGLDEGIDDGLEARAAAVATSGQVAAGAPEDREDGFAQRLAADGRLLDTTGPPRPVTSDGRVAGIDGTVRVLAVRGRGGEMVVVGQSLEDRDETLADLAGAFAVGAPLAIVLASLLGYVLAAAALRPVEAMRRSADGVSLERPETLPLPEARDEIRRLGETLNAMLDRLRRSYERERRFVADASHELRTPVAVIKAELEAALRRAPADADLRAALVAGIEECDHLAQLAEDLLTVARSGEGGLPVQPEPLVVEELLSGVRDRFGDRAAERGRPIAVESPDGLRVSADELRLRQALGNLVDNALRHGDGPIVLRSRANGATVDLEVADEGPGFPPELRERAFERFARGDAARTRGGSGLGLAIVRAIAEAHGGQAEIVPEGRGATVRIRLRRV